MSLSRNYCIPASHHHSEGVKDVSDYEERLQRRYVNLEERWEGRAAQARAEPCAGRVADLVRAVAPAVEEIDPELVRQDEEKLREQRRADNLRRLEAPVLTQRMSDGSIRFRDDLQIREGRTSR
jgi:hypothetical protein